MQALMNAVASVTDNWWDLPMAVWYANMLSGLTTQFLNTSSTGANLIGEWITQLKIRRSSLLRPGACKIHTRWTTGSGPHASHG